MADNTQAAANQAFVQPPKTLASGEVRLKFVAVLPGDAARGLVPAYYFTILNAHGAEAGHISFRVGDTDHVRLFAGHIGYEVLKPFRGRGFALLACQAIAPFVRQFYQEIIITADPDNAASLKTIQRLGAVFIDQVPVSPDDPHYQRGSRIKARYRWKP